MIDSRQLNLDRIGVSSPDLATNQLSGLLISSVSTFHLNRPLVVDNSSEESQNLFAQLQEYPGIIISSAKPS